jgi:DNA-binding CsgD family transcriptional regulator
MGKSTQECAQELGISIDTVWTHIKKAMKKLDARTRIHAVAEALRRQLLD